MKIGSSVRNAVVTSLVCAFALLGDVCATPAAPVPGVAAEEQDYGDHDGDSITGVWRGVYVNQNAIESVAYLDICEHANGTLTGRWGNDPQGALTIEQGERVTEGVYQWEAVSNADQMGRYRVRVSLQSEAMQLAITYTWRQAGQVKGLTAVSTLTKSPSH